jgi:hypothetical protein
MKGHLSAEQLKEYSYKDLQALAKDMGVSASGKAEEIIDRIVAVEVDVPEESQLTEEEKAAAEATAGLVKVKAVTRFLDKQLNQIKDAGEAYSVSRERAEELAAAGVAEIVG